MDTITSKLDKVNPMNAQIPTKDNSDGSFVSQINSRVDELREIRAELEDMKTKLDGFVDDVEKAMQPLLVLNQREVKKEPEIDKILKKM